MINATIQDSTKLLSRVRGLIERGERVSKSDCVQLLHVPDLLALARLARIPRDRRFGKNAFYTSAEIQLDHHLVPSVHFGPSVLPETLVTILDELRIQQDNAKSLIGVVLSAQAADTAENFAAHPTAAQTLRTVAVARIALDNVAHIALYAHNVAQEVPFVALSYGADTLVQEHHPETFAQSESATVNPFVELRIAELPSSERPDSAQSVSARIIEARFTPIEVDGKLSAKSGI